MDNSQRQAIAIMIQSIQAQLVGIQGILGLGMTPQTSAPPTAFSTKDSEILTDEEEDRLEKRMEAVRKEAEQETEEIQRRWAERRSAIDNAGVF